METVHHFKCIDLVIDSTNKKLPEKFIKALYRTLKNYFDYFTIKY